MLAHPIDKLGGGEDLLIEVNVGIEGSVKNHGILLAYASGDIAQSPTFSLRLIGNSEELLSS